MEKKDKKKAVGKEPKKDGGDTILKKERKLSYHDKIRAHFKDCDTATVEEIMTITGADKRNSRVAMNIICNPKRVKNPMKFSYVKATGTFYLVNDGFGRQGQTEVPVPEETAKKEKAEETKEGETEIRANP